MGMGRLNTIREIIRVRGVLFPGAAISALGIYDALSNQFDLPKLGRLFGLGVDLLPIWFWFFALEGVLIYGLFEFVRRNVDMRGNALEQASDVEVNEEAAPSGRSQAASARQPDMKLIDVAERVSKALGDDASMEDIAKELIDKAVHRDLAVWGRTGRKALRTFSQYERTVAAFDLVKLELRVPTGFDVVRYKDIMFSKADVDEVWPLTAE